MPNLTAPAGGSAYIEVSFSPSLELVSPVRDFVMNFYQRALNQPDFTARLGVATHELLENAVKYSVDGTTRLRVDRVDSTSGLRVRIQTWNRAHPGHVEAVSRAVRELNAAPDPLAYYQAQMRRTAKAASGSGLGLGRIRAEADMTLECRDDDGFVVVTAEASEAL